MRRLDFPYYKVHKRDKKLLSWIDARKEAFASLEEAKRFIVEELNGEESRILVVEKNKRYIFEN